MKCYDNIYYQWVMYIIDKCKPEILRGLISRIKYINKVSTNVDVFLSN